MTEAQLKLFPAFRNLPIYDESDVRANSITTLHGTGNYQRIRECSTLQDVETCLKDLRFVPLGGLRVPNFQGPVVVAYFGERPAANPTSQ